MDNKTLLRRSFDVKYYLRQMVVCLALLAGMLAVSVPLSIVTEQTVTLWAGIIGYLIILSPICSYYLYRLWEICRRPQDYLLCEAVAVKAHPAMGRRIFFEVEITHPDGSSETLETKGVFSLSILTDAYWGEIKGQRLRILYDAATWRVVTVDRVENENI